MDGHNHSSLFYQITSCDFFANTFEPPPYSGFIICALTALATRFPTFSNRLPSTKEINTFDRKVRWTFHWLDWIK